MRRVAWHPKLGTAHIARSTSAEEVLVLVAQNLKRLDPIHCTASLHALAKHGPLKDDRLARRSLTALLLRQEDFAKRKCLDGRQLSNTLWAVARLRQPVLEAVPNLANEVAFQLASKAQQLNHQDVSNGLWAMAALDADLEDSWFG
eukprot:Skav230152  [mRNA]  locus=scaffold1301:451059:454600:- [translate_table: standard]